jgi:surface antigen
MRLIAIMIFLGLLVGITACDPYSKRQPRAMIGVGGGAVPGQVIGEATETKLLDDAIGQRMERHDRVRLNDTLESTPSYETVTWINPDSGHEFAVTPQPVFEDPQTNMICRRVRLRMETDGQPEEVAAVACRQSGRWILQ